MIKTILTILVLSFPVFAQSINQAFQREVILKRYKDGKVVQEHVRRSQFIRDDRGRLIERVIFKTPNLKGVSDQQVREIASGQKFGQVIEGVSQYFGDYDHREFGSTVEVKDVWDAHWPAGTTVKVYFSTDFNSELHILMQALNAWNVLNTGVTFVYAGVSETVQQCPSCLTVIRNTALGSTGRFHYGERADNPGIIVTAYIELGTMKGNTLITSLAHEIGHSLGLFHSEEGLMQERVRKGVLILPGPKEAEAVRAIYNP